MKRWMCFALGLVVFSPGVAFAETCPEPTEVQGVDVEDGVYAVSATVEVKPYMYIANAGEDTVSKFATDLNREVARYSTAFWNGGIGGAGAALPNHDAWSGPAPSRSAVDTDGNAFVANRGFNRVAEVVKILATGCVDRNSNGVCDTSTDLNGDGTISTSEMYPIVDLNGNGVIDDDEIRDERIAWIRRVGGSNEVARALTIDRDGFIWVGMFNTQRVYKLDPTTGATLLGPIAISGAPYGAVVDSANRLYTASLGATTQTRFAVDNPSGTQQTYAIANGYGLTLGRDDKGKEWVAASHAGGLGFQLFDPSNLASTTRSISGYSTRGISFDQDGHLVISAANGTSMTGATKLRTDGSVIWTRTAPAGCASGEQRGAIVDANNDIWVVALLDHKVCKYHADGTVGVQLPTGRSPYTYSDASGIGLQFSDPTGKVTFRNEALINGDNYDWSGADMCFPGSGDVTVTVAAANTEAALEFANPAAMPLADQAGVLCGVVPSGVVGRHIQFVFTIKTGGEVVAETETGDCGVDLPDPGLPPVTGCTDTPLTPGSVPINERCLSGDTPLADLVFTRVSVCKGACADWNVPVTVAVANRGGRIAENVTYTLVRSTGGPALATFTLGTLAPGAGAVFGPVALNPEDWGDADVTAVLSVGDSSTECDTSNNTLDLGPWPYPIDDVDGDRLDVACDNCPTVFNPSQANADGDSDGDACDPCTDVDGDGHGQPSPACVVGAGTCVLGCDDCDDGDGSVNPGQSEVCDGVDNNCSGATDDEDPALVRPLCPNQTGVCGGARVPATYCVGGGWLACDGAAYALHSLGAYHPTADLCDGLDNDCDGASDEDFQASATTCGVGHCQRTGVVTCTDGVLDDTCVPGPSQIEVCDGVDNDCDGLVDGFDDSLLLIPCENQKGVCAGAMRSPELCVGGEWEACPPSLYAGYAFPRYGQLDLCDGFDNDCDGELDEDFVSGPTTCGLGECSAAGTLQCVLGQAQSSCVPGLPTAEVCNGLDNDCNGFADINLVGASVCPGLNTATLACPPPVTSLATGEVVFVDLVTPSSGTFQCRLDGQAWFDCSGDPRCSGGSGPQHCQGVRLELSDLPPGSHTLLVRAVDPAGNPDESPAYCAWTVDTTVPDTLLLSHPDLLSQSGSASFTFGSNIDNVDTFMCALDAGTEPEPEAFVACDAVTHFTDLGEGAHTLVVYVVSTDGVADENPVVFNWVIDFTSPDTAITTDAGAVACSDTVTFEFTSESDDHAGFRCRLSQVSPVQTTGTFGTCNQGSFTAAGLADGVYTFEVAAYDVHGIQDPSPASRTFRVDTVTPDTFIDAAPNNPSTSARATFAFSASEAEVTYRCALVAGDAGAPEAGDWAPCSATPSFDDLADGPHTLFVAAADMGCLVDETPATYTWIVDTTLPATAFLTTPHSLVGSGESSAFTYHDPNDAEHDTFECRHNGGAWFDCDGGAHDLGVLSPGEHTFMVRSCSAVSDLCALDPEAFTWNVTVSPCPRDGDAPELTCAGGQVVECVDGAGAVVPATFAPEMIDACGVAWSDWSGPDVFLPGTSLVVFTAADHNDNLASCVTNVTVVDTTPPTITCPEPEAHATPESGCTLAVDFGTVAGVDGCSGDVVTVVSDAPLAYTVGETTVHFTAVDLAGNAASCTTTVTVTDDVPPVIDCAQTVTRNAEADACSWRGTISATASDNCSVDTVTLGELKSYPVGVHTVDFEATDDRDNVGTCQSELMVLDVTSPEVDCGTWDAERDRIRVSATDACTAVATAHDVACVLASGQTAQDCTASAEGDLVTVAGGIGAPFTLRWTARGEDPSGNVTNVVCEQPLDLDTDGDGIVDSEDNCPLIDNPDQANANGSPFGDVCDPNPFVGLGTEGGGGCASGPVDAGLPLALLFALGAALWIRRRRLGASI